MASAPRVGHFVNQRRLPDPCSPDGVDRGDNDDDDDDDDDDDNELGMPHGGGDPKPGDVG